MKIVIAVLFVLGCGWALLAWVLVLLPFGIVKPEYRYQSHDVAFSLIGSSLALAGYWIWFGWGYCWKKGRFPGMSDRAFWTLSLIIHVLWALAIPFGYQETTLDFWLIGDTLPFRSWIAINIVVALAAIFAASRTPQKPSTGSY